MEYRKLLIGRKMRFKRIRKKIAREFFFIFRALHGWFQKAILQYFQNTEDNLPKHPRIKNI